MNTDLYVAIALGGAVFFLVLWVSSWRTYRNMTRVERAQAQISSDERKRKRRNPAQMFDDALLRAGYRGDRAPIAVALIGTYLAVVFLAVALEVPALLAAGAGAPLIVLLALGVSSIFAARQRAKFAYQLKQLFDLLKGQLEAGYGTQRALELVVPNLQNPLREEFQEALDRTRASVSLIESLERVQHRFPSRGFDLFLAALVVDREQGGSLAKTLTRASTMLQREFDLNNQASSKLASAKQTFWGVLGILIFIAVSVIGGADDIAREAYTSSIGLVVLSVLGVVAAWGVFRAVKMFNSAGGEI